MQTVALHHILLKSPLLAQDLEKELMLGADFEELAKQYSACPSGQYGGFAGYHTQDHLPDSIITALANHESERAFTAPVKSQYGYHLLKPVGVKPDTVLSDDNVTETPDFNVFVEEEVAETAADSEAVESIDESNLTATTDQTNELGLEPISAIPSKDNI